MRQIPQQLKQQVYPQQIKSLLKQISRLLIALVMVILMGITTAVPANAAIISRNSNIVHLASGSRQTPLFDSTTVRLGITPTGWSNSDDLTIDLNPPIPYQQILSEIALSGFYGTQGAPKFPDKEELQKELNRRGLTISEPWVGTYFTLGEEGKKESQRIFDEQMKFMEGFDSDIIVVAELGCAVHQQPINPLTNRPKFSEKQWEDLTNGLIDLAQKAEANQMKLVYHPHIGTGVETIQDVEKLMEMTQGTPLKLLLDTGHLYYAGATNTEIIGLVNKYGERIKHVHLKNIRQSVLDDSKQNGWSFLTSIREGVFTVPGDVGAINFDEILQALANANYEGWLIVEAEQDPNTTMKQYDKTPLDYALMARDYLRQTTGL
ncbi:MAG: myo-inosose-2 dehydratase [Nostocaceae cyanobacterium]|nr:myo-inosose-2 dehydratase [Nostocaceae cyanobacterium]